MACASNTTVASLQAALARDHFAVVPAAAMFELLSVQPEHAAALWDLWDEAVPQLDESGAEVYPFKDTLTSYYDLHTAKLDEAPRRAAGHDGCVDGVVTAICRARVVEHIDPTTNHSVSNFRLHKAWPTAADRNPVMRAMLQFVAELLAPSELSPLLSEHGEPARFEAMVSAYRVTRGGHERFELGEPGPEGIHQDSADLTVVVMMDRRNVAEDAGANRVWSVAQPCGKPSAEDVASGRMLAETTLRDRLDTLLVLDRHVKHEACEIAPAQPGPAVRDVWTLEVRRPRSKGG